MFTVLQQGNKQSVMYEHLERVYNVCVSGLDRTGEGSTGEKGERLGLGDIDGEELLRFSMKLVLLLFVLVLG